jgi:hypothetical protein
LGGDGEQAEQGRCHATPSGKWHWYFSREKGFRDGTAAM